MPETYIHETSSWAAQGMGQDVIDLFIFVPLLALCGFFVQSGRKVFLILLGGLLLYSIYTFTLYAFCVHFNRLFFIYCAALGLSFYAAVFLVWRLMAENINAWFNRRLSTLFLGLLFLAVTMFFFLAWLAEDLPAVLSGLPPKSLVEVGLFTNPVHVLDLSIVLPTMALASVKLLRKEPLGYVLFPIVVAFAAMMSTAIGGMAVVMKLKNVVESWNLAYGAGTMVLVDMVVLGYFMKFLKRNDFRT
ncbi:MAG TPA: hypothetical protein VJ873_02795 [bacterium]|nr:hypothetical protein [bacterium]